MGCFKSVKVSDGKKDELGEVIPVPFLQIDKGAGKPTLAQIAKFEAAFLEPICETALARGILPNPEKLDKDGKFVNFAAGDVEGLELLRDKLKKKFKTLQKEDVKKRPLTALAYN
jgi:hypothetical protein